jgi:proton-coupled amino acid transporter
MAQVQGTSAKKAFFMLLKAFIGTGVLFLPQAFQYGGMGFSIGMLILLGYLNLYCMNLLVEASIAMGGLSFGDLAGQLFGESFRQMILGSIAVSQVHYIIKFRWDLVVLTIYLLLQIYAI